MKMNSEQSRWYLETTSTIMKVHKEMVWFLWKRSQKV